MKNVLVNFFRHQGNSNNKKDQHKQYNRCLFFLHKPPATTYAYAMCSQNVK